MLQQIRCVDKQRKVQATNISMALMDGVTSEPSTMTSDLTYVGEIEQGTSRVPLDLQVMGATEGEQGRHRTLLHHLHLVGLWGETQEEVNLTSKKGEEWSGFEGPSHTSVNPSN